MRRVFLTTWKANCRPEIWAQKKATAHVHGGLKDIVSYLKFYYPALCLLMGLVRGRRCGGFVRIGRLYQAWW